MKQVSQNVWKTDAGRFLVRVTQRRQGGRRLQVERTFPDRATAEKFVQEWNVARAYRAAGLRAPLSTLAPRATVGTILAAYVKEIESLGRSAAHVKTVRRVVKFILKGMGEAKPVPLTRQDLVDFAGWARAMSWK